MKPNKISVDKNPPVDTIFNVRQIREYIKLYDKLPNQEIIKNSAIKYPKITKVIRSWFWKKYAPDKKMLSTGDPQKENTMLFSLVDGTFLGYSKDLL